LYTMSLHKLYTMLLFTRCAPLLPVAPVPYQHNGGDDYSREHGEAYYHAEYEERDGYRCYRQHDKNEQPYGIV